ncbi:cyclophilin-like fold protein [Parasphaerochaeta coccoides]|uniref:Cyclophilin-like domain-containing protein n=1 Tax=Parasphaerochaeta coccoides (strain ATCC BAA-1237 / DSM 17374 / SPN1) TaxID=760011 RepID=F4GK14_PARC1|nr:cyclophilin-like fold protein [Parasphaerochaeta coccoides]AEC01786.1 hypothetical protein Spico_0558 [Parasphaerochaeta coccoides DSM 17374]
MKRIMPTIMLFMLLALTACNSTNSSLISDDTSSTVTATDKTGATGAQTPEPSSNADVISEEPADTDTGSPAAAPPLFDTKPPEATSSTVKPDVTSSSAPAKPPDTPSPTPSSTPEPEPIEPTKTEEIDMSKMMITVGSTTFTATMENNASVKALMELLVKEPLTIQMSEYGGFEQVGSLGQRLPSNDLQTTASAGDIVLYSSNNIVIFYGSNSWSYTRLGKIESAGAKEIKDAFGSGASVTLSIN